MQKSLNHSVNQLVQTRTIKVTKQVTVSEWVTESSVLPICLKIYRRIWEHMHMYVNCEPYEQAKAEYFIIPVSEVNQYKAFLIWMIGCDRSPEVRSLNSLDGIHNHSEASINKEVWCTTEHAHFDHYTQNAH